MLALWVRVVGQEGSAGESRSEGCNRDFLALEGWRRGRTACTTGSLLDLVAMEF